MRRSAVVGLAILVALPGASPAVAQVARPSLTGQVLDQATRAPVRAAVVELVKKHRRVLTDSLGRFAFPDLPAATYVLMASALGYQDGIGSAVPGSPAVLLLAPAPVPLTAIVALTRTSSRRIRGATVQVFGRDDLLAAGDIPMAQFLHWKAPLQTRPCRLPDIQSSMLLGVPSRDAASARRRSGGDAAGGMMTTCIVGAHGALGPFEVMLDGQPLTYSDELWDHMAWDLGRVEVVYQRSGVDAPFGGSFARPFAFVRLYTIEYLSRAAPRVSELCEHVTTLDILRNPYIASVCPPEDRGRPAHP